MWRLSYPLHIPRPCSLAALRPRVFWTHGVGLLRLRVSPAITSRRCSLGGHYWRTSTCATPCQPAWTTEGQVLPLTSELWREQHLHIVLFDHNSSFGTDLLARNNYLGEVLLRLGSLPKEAEDPAGLRPTGCRESAVLRRRSGGMLDEAASSSGANDR